MTCLSLLIVNYNSWTLCVEAIRSFARTLPAELDGQPLEWEAIVVDNNSPMGDPEAEREVERLCAASGGRLIRHEENSGYSRGMNLAHAHSRGDWILVSNPDINYLPETVAPLLAAMRRDPSIGAAAPRGYLCDDRSALLPPNILPTPRDLVGSVLAELSTFWNHRYSRKRTREAVRVWDARDDVDLTMLSGCCFLMRRSDIERLGFFDERFPLYYEDTDLSVRLKRAGKRIVQVAGASVVHYYDRSGQTDNAEKMRRYWISKNLYFRKHFGRFGSFLQSRVRQLQESRFGQRRKAINPYPDYVDLGEGHGRPVLRFPNATGRVLIEIGLDPLFLLTAAAFTDEREWRPTQQLMNCFGPTTYWFRVIDLEAPERPVLSVSSYRLLYPVVALDAGPEAEELARRQIERVAAASADRETAIPETATQQAANRRG